MQQQQAAATTAATAELSAWSPWFANDDIICVGMTRCIAERRRRREAPGGFVVEWMLLFFFGVPLLHEYPPPLLCGVAVGCWRGVRCALLAILLRARLSSTRWRKSDLGPLPVVEIGVLVARIRPPTASGTISRYGSTVTEKDTIFRAVQQSTRERTGFFYNRR